MSQPSSFSPINCSLPIKAAKLHVSIAQDGILWFNVIAMPLISLFGITGNIFSFIILKEGATKSVSHLYLSCLSVFDSLTILSFQYSFYSNIVLQPILVKLYNQVTFIEKYLTNYSTCPLRTYTSFSMRIISTWTIVVFTIDRFIVIAYPFKSRHLSTIRNTCIVIGSMVVVSFLINIPWLFGYVKDPVPCTDRVRCKGNELLYYMVLVEISFLSAIPSAIIFFCNVAIILILQKRQSHSTLYSKKEALQQEKQITIRLLLVSSAFLLLNLPSFIVMIIKTVYKFKYKNNLNYGIMADLFHIGYLLYLINLSINFILYCLTGSTFRKAAWSLLCCRINRMKHYRNVILKSNSSETKVSYMPRRISSSSNGKNRVTIELPNKLENFNNIQYDNNNISSKPMKK